MGRDRVVGRLTCWTDNIIIITLCNRHAKTRTAHIVNYHDDGDDENETQQYTTTVAFFTYISRYINIISLAAELLKSRPGALSLLSISELYRDLK